VPYATPRDDSLPRIGKRLDDGRTASQSWAIMRFRRRSAGAKAVYNSWGKASTIRASTSTHQRPQVIPPAYACSRA